MIMMPKGRQFPRNHSGLLSLGLGFRVVLARDLIPNFESESAASGSAPSSRLEKTLTRKRRRPPTTI